MIAPEIRILTPLIAAVCVLPGIRAAAQDEPGNFLDFAIFNLPDRYIADIPKEKRARLLAVVSARVSDKRLDYPNNYLNWYSDGARIGATSRFWIKLLPRPSKTKEGLRPLVFVHMDKPFADGSKPSADQTFILRYDGKDWIDVTEEVLPKAIDRTMHLRPYRNFDGIRVCEYETYQRNDGQGDAYKSGRIVHVLVWNGNRFEVKTPDALRLNDNLRELPETQGADHQESEGVSLRYWRRGLIR